MKSKNLHIILAFIKAPWPLVIILNIISYILFVIIFKSEEPISNSIFFVTLFSLTISYANLLVFGMPLYLIFYKKNIFFTPIPIISCFLIGIIEGLICVYYDVFYLVTITPFILCSVFVGYCLTRKIRKITNE